MKVVVDLGTDRIRIASMYGAKLPVENDRYLSEHFQNISAK